MRATGFNHVSVVAHDLDRSVRFYTEVFGMEKIPTYTFAFPVQYLRLGDLQLHLFEREAEAPAFHHIGINVDDFEEAYRRAKALGILEKESFFSDMYELPDGSVQM
jgi:catechol 2,3-dioxygenase-like lactoylglutathione lyase family enzyme